MDLNTFFKEIEQYLDSKQELTEQEESILNKIRAIQKAEGN